MATPWTNRRIDQALRELRDASRTQPVFSAEWEQALEARVHREVEARFGVAAWTQPLQRMAHGSETDGARLPAVGPAKAGITDVHTERVSVLGMMEVVFGMVRQPALALRSLSGVGFALATVVIVVAGVLAYRQSDDSTLANRPRDPQTSSAVAVIPAIPFGEGTGFAVSVFGGSLAVAPSKVIAPTAAPVRAGVRRPKPIPLNPTPGVFSQWGTSVFSDDEALTRPWEGGKSIFSS